MSAGSIDAVSLTEKFAAFDGLWSPKIVAALNDYHVKLAKIEGESVWHSHADTDELFFVVEGRMEIDLPDSTVHLEKGDLYVVPRGVEHRPRAAEECHLLLIEPAGTVNTGDAGGELTAGTGEWL